MILPAYPNLTSKAPYFKSTTIHTVADFDAIYSQLQGADDIIYRGVNEAKYKIFTSGQRHWLTRGLKHHTPYIDFIDKLLRNIRSNKVLDAYYRSLNIFPNDILYLTYLQHYGAPTPMLDFTYNLNVGLYFALDGLRQSTSNNDIDDYFSIYYWNLKECGLELVNIVQFYFNGHKSGEQFLEQFLRENPDVEVNDVLLRDLDLFTKWKKPHNPYDDGLCSIKCGLLDNPKTANRLVMDKTNQQLLWSNLNIIAQNGCLIMYPEDTMPLEEYIHQRKFLPKLHCVNIHKSLADYIRQKINLTREQIYPQEEEIAKDAFQRYLKRLM